MSPSITVAWRRLLTGGPLTRADKFPLASRQEDHHDGERQNGRARLVATNLAVSRPSARIGPQEDGRLQVRGDGRQGSQTSGRGGMSAATENYATAAERGPM